MNKESELDRLFAIIAHQGVEAVLADIQDHQDLMEELAERCFSAGMIPESHYLLYLQNPQD